jgi:acyl-CoA synthetase (AMP-forming)/AMP-acid ligase II
MSQARPNQPFDFPRAAVPDVVLGAAEVQGDRPALVDAVSGETISYRTLTELVSRVAGGLAASGLRRGDVVAMYAPNSILFPVACLAAMRAGATVTLANPLYKPDELAAQLRDCGAAHVVTVGALVPNALAAGAREVFLLDRLDGYRSIRDLDGDPPDPTSDPTVDWETELALLAYSSGTTGVPKGVMLSHANITANILQMAHAMRVEPATRVLAVLPMFHAYGFTAMLCLSLYAGATIVVLPRFDLAQFLGAISTHRITRVLVAPPIAVALARHPLVDEYDLSSLEQILSSAAPLDPETAAAVQRRIGVPVVQAFGLTEASPSVFVPPAGELPPPGSVGKPLPGTEIRLVSPEDGRDATSGELYVRGPQVMRGYLGRPAETAEMIDADGWLHTGDIARVDDDGWFYITGRVKELIKYKGYQVAPAELEGVLRGHPAVADAVVVGAPDGDGNEIPLAFVVTAPGATPDPDEIMSYVAERVAPYKKVRQVEFISEIPRSPAGKVLRRQLPSWSGLRPRDGRHEELMER